MSGTLGLSSPWARGKVREPLRSELAALIPDGYVVGLSVAPNHGKVKAWVNSAATVQAKVYPDYYDAETAIRSCIAWAVADARAYRGVAVTTDAEGWVRLIEEAGLA